MAPIPTERLTVGPRFCLCFVTAALLFFAYTGFAQSPALSGSQSGAQASPGQGRAVSFQILDQKRVFFGHHSITLNRVAPPVFPAPAPTPTPAPVDQTPVPYEYDALLCCGATVYDDQYTVIASPGEAKHGDQLLADQEQRLSHGFRPMKPFLAAILAILSCLTAGAFAQGPGDLNSGSQLSQNISTGAYSFSWWGVGGYTYLIETSDDLINWTYLPVVESGSDSAIQWGFTSNSGSLFMKLEYINVPPAQLSGTALNGPVDPSSGLPEDWELFYYGQLGANPSGYVSWSGSTVTNLQAYQNGYNPLDYYTGAVPSLSFPTGGINSGGTLTLLVTDQNGNPLAGAPVNFSIDYGGLAAPGSASYAQNVQVASAANGQASVVVLPPWLPADYTVTAPGCRAILGYNTGRGARGCRYSEPSPRSRNGFSDIDSRTDCFDRKLGHHRL